MRPDELPRYLPIRDRRMTKRGSHEPAEQAVRPHLRPSDGQDREGPAGCPPAEPAGRGQRRCARDRRRDRANLPFYRPEAGSLTITEPETAMVRRLERRAREQAPQAKILRAPAEDLPFGDGTFDTVVSALVLCGVSDQPRALRQLRRVLRPGGQLLFIEHVRSGDPRLARHQDRMSWLCQLVVCCDCNRPTLTSIQEAGFTVTDVEHLTLHNAPSFVRPLIVGRATAPVGAASRDGQLVRQDLS